MLQKIKLLVLFCGALLAATTQADTLVLPNNKEATQAILEMIELPKDLAKDAKIKLGTCIPAVKATYSGQVACTVAIKIGAGTSETQADFYRKGKKWLAQPSESQDKLPFPDPKLM